MVGAHFSERLHLPFYCLNCLQLRLTLLQEQLMAYRVHTLHVIFIISENALFRI